MDTFRQIHFILNPASGPEDDHFEEVRAACAACRGAVLHELEPGSDVTKIVQGSVADGADLIVAAGGDGTVRSVAEATLPTDLPMGIVPSGSANIFATDLEIPMDPEEAVALFERPSPSIRQVDVARVNGTLFLVRFGLGWHAAMTVEAPADMKRSLGRWAYAVNAARIRFRQKRVSYTIVSDGEKRLERGVSCIVANTATLGIGDWSVSDEVDVSSGRLHVYMIPRASWTNVAGLLLRSTVSPGAAKDLSRSRGGGVVEWPADKVVVDARPVQVAAIDGDSYEGDFPATITVQAGALSVVVP